MLKLLVVRFSLTSTLESCLFSALKVWFLYAEKYNTDLSLAFHANQVFSPALLL